MNLTKRTNRTTKIWIGVGVFVVTGGGAMGCVLQPAPALADASVQALRAADSGVACAHASGRGVRLAEHKDHTQAPKEAGEGGQSSSLANLSSDLAFAVR